MSDPVVKMEPRWAGDPPRIVEVSLVPHLQIVLNPDRAKAAEVQQAVKDNDGYCPCQFVKTPETKCMCKEFREQTAPGLCHCQLYLKQERE